MADIQPYFAAPVRKRYADDLTESLSDCLFGTSTSRAFLDITVETGGDAETSYDVDSQKRGVLAKPLPGIGDKAERQPGEVWISVLKGDMFCRVYGDKLGRSRLKGVEQFAGRPVPDSVAEPVAAKLGELCLKIFGS